MHREGSWLHVAARGAVYDAGELKFGRVTTIDEPLLRIYHGKKWKFQDNQDGHDDDCNSDCRSSSHAADIALVLLSASLG